MRKFYKLAAFLSVGAMLCLNNAEAQSVSDFENLTLSANSSWDGSDLSGSQSGNIFSAAFTSGDAIFPNVFDSSYGGYWTGGFAFTNMTDSVTTGASNKFSAKAASGYNGSSQYAVAKSNSVIHLNGAAANNTVSGLYITNNTYAYNVMRDGNQFSKKFGGTTGNDPDWFKVTIWGYSGGNMTTDSVEFFLADYRFSNNAQDYRVKTWEWVDLTSLGNLDSVLFVLNSSDVGQWGMNTPEFFCIDNFNGTAPSSIVENKTTIDFEVYPNPSNGTVFINSTQDIDQLTVYDLTGKEVLTDVNLVSGVHQLDVSTLNEGVYFVRLTSTGQISTKRLIVQ